MLSQLQMTKLNYYPLKKRFGHTYDEAHVTADDAMLHTRPSFRKAPKMTMFVMTNSKRLIENLSNLLTYEFQGFWSEKCQARP